MLRDQYGQRMPGGENRQDRRKSPPRPAPMTKQSGGMLQTRPDSSPRKHITSVKFNKYKGNNFSGETAAGKYPVEAVKNMAEIAEYTEKHIDYKKRFTHTEYNINSNLDAISHAVCAMAIDVNAKCIVVNSVSGKTARMVSRFRCPCDILGTTTNEKAWRQLNLSWGVTPYLSEEYSSVDVMFYQALNQAEKLFNLESGDNVVLTGGRINGSSGNTDTIKVETVK